MGLFDFFKKNEVKTVVEPDISKYHVGIVMKNVNVNDMIRSLNEYSELYAGDEVTEHDLWYDRVGDNWIYLCISDSKGDFNNFQNMILWLSEKAGVIFGYAYSDKKGIFPIVSFPNTESEFGDSCIGIMDHKNYFYEVPGAKLELRTPSGEECDKFILKKFGFDVAGLMKLTKNKTQTIKVKF